MKGLKKHKSTRNRRQGTEDTINAADKPEE